MPRAPPESSSKNEDDNVETYSPPRHTQRHNADAEGANDSEDENDGNDSADDSKKDDEDDGDDDYGNNDDIVQVEHSSASVSSVTFVVRSCSIHV